MAGFGWSVTVLGRAWRDWSTRRANEAEEAAIERYELMSRGGTLRWTRLHGVLDRLALAGCFLIAGFTLYVLYVVGQPLLPARMVTEGQTADAGSLVSEHSAAPVGDQSAGAGNRKVAGASVSTSGKQTASHPASPTVAPTSSSRSPVTAQVAASPSPQPTPSPGISPSPAPSKNTNATP